MATHLATRRPPLVLSWGSALKAVQIPACALKAVFQVQVARVGKTWHASCARIPRPRVALAHPNRFCMSYSVPHCVSRLPGVSWGPWARARKGSPTVLSRSSCKVQEGGATRLLRALSSTSSPKVVPHDRWILWLRGSLVAASPEGVPRVHRGRSPLGHYNCQVWLVFIPSVGPLPPPPPCAPVPCQHPRSRDYLCGCDYCKVHRWRPSLRARTGCTEEDRL